MRSHELTHDTLTTCFLSKCVVANDSVCSGFALLIFLCMTGVLECRHMKRRLAGRVQIIPCNWTGPSGPAALVQTVYPFWRIQMRRTTGNIIAAGRKCPDRACRQAGSITAGVTGIARHHARRDRYSAMQTDCSAIGMPQPVMRMNQHTDRGGEYTIRLLRPFLKGKIGWTVRWIHCPSGGRGGDAVHLPPGPGIQRIGFCATSGLKMGPEFRPCIANKDNRPTGRGRSIFGLGMKPAPGQQPNLQQALRQQGIGHDSPFPDDPGRQSGGAISKLSN